MMNHTDIIAIAQRTVALEAASIEGLKAFLNADFARAVEVIQQSGGRLVVSGIGKSAIIAQKIVATLNSTGTPSLYMHAADAIHGDLGMVTPQDVVMIISKSGESPEIKVLVPLVKNFGNTLIGMVGNTESFLALGSDIVLNTTVSQEACPNNLAPTSSTTAQMVMGDALAVCLMELNGFTARDFAKYHPGGALGKKLYLRVTDLAAKNAKPAVGLDASLKEVIVVMTENRLGATAVVDENGILKGMITDGDLRRMLEKTNNLSQINASAIMTPHPKSIQEDAMAVEALDILRKYNINHLLVTNSTNHYAGVVHMHDLVQEGLI